VVPVLWKPTCRKSFAKELPNLSYKVLASSLPAAFWRSQALLLDVRDCSQLQNVKSLLIDSLLACKPLVGGLDTVFEANSWFPP
jgi:hypothetical protein